VRANGPFERGEWEQEIRANRPVLQLAKRTPLERLVTKKLRRQLSPIFVTAVERTRIPIWSRRAKLELAVDRGAIRRQGHPDLEAISEIEIELKQGDRLELCRVAK
jgi:inorganic triphosphatase YgiF